MPGARSEITEHSFHLGSNADGSGTRFRVGHARHVVVTISSDNLANLTVKCQGSAKWTAPDFSAARSFSNEWEYIGMFDYQDAEIISGDTGIVFGGADDVRILMPNFDGMEWLNFEISGYVAGNLYVSGRLYNNE